MMKIADIQAGNQVILDACNTEQGRSKLASKLEDYANQIMGFGLDKTAATGSFIRDHIREVSFTNRIIPPRDITPAECQIGLESDANLVKIEFMEPESPGALRVSYRGTPETSFIRAPRYATPFYTIMSKIVEKHEDELMVYRDMPLTKIVEDQIIKDMQYVFDRTNLIHFEACVQEAQRLAYGGTVTAMRASTYATALKVSVIKGRNAQLAAIDDFTVRPILKTDINDLGKLLSQFNRESDPTKGTARQLVIDKILISETDFRDVNAWTLQDLGDRVASEVVENGWRYKQLVGTNYIVTNKTQVLKPGNVYGFAPPEFMGNNYVLQRAKFYVDKVINVIKWVSWMKVGFSIGNIMTVVKLELYGGNVAPGTLANAPDLNHEYVEPVRERDMFRNINKVDDGSTIGTVSVY
jgi:hypothetical protein